MTVYISDDIRNAICSAFSTAYGASPKLRYYAATTLPADEAASATGTQLVEMTLPSTPFASPSAGSMAKSGTWSGTATADGVPAYYRILTSGGTVKEQGSISVAKTVATSASTAALSNILTFASTTGISEGQAISGTGIPTGATVLTGGITSTTVAMSLASTAGVSSGASITFGDTAGDLTISDGTITSGQTVTVNTFTKVAPG